MADKRIIALMMLQTLIWLYPPRKGTLTAIRLEERRRKSGFSTWFRGLFYKSHSDSLLYRQSDGTQGQKSSKESDPGSKEKKITKATTPELLSKNKTSLPVQDTHHEDFEEKPVAPGVRSFREFLWRFNTNAW
eukprot:CAMPEP_0167742486 /NCGR_PEP_ID=MMETSP0110_2-20121227/1461_1 /TAXON_ID=629695 /ORGANISM="Gymnochlora sp., Strain CCMP2014" /LENGTH=132 /DNA_ID=CAMNT_0007626699 /DNA_START=1 /DNA_END=396 /DNA_ORIENTATION=-